jgi:phosphoserine phosphatase RsbU/P
MKFGNLKFYKTTSLNTKTTLLYMLLAMFSISLIIGLIFENQTDLIVKNTILEAEKVVYTVNSEIQVLKDLPDEKKMARAMAEVLKSVNITKYVIFNEKAEPLVVFPESDSAGISARMEFIYINRAIFKKENEGKIFHAEIVQSPWEMKGLQFINFYMPHTHIKDKNLIIKISVSIMGIDSKINRLYRQCALLIAIMILIVIFFAFLLNKMIIRPVKQLSEASSTVAKGDYSVQLSINNDDEIGSLASSFNEMVRSLDTTSTRLKETINNLETQNDIIQTELDMARTIQIGMLPKKIDFDRIGLSVYYKALGKISGDYYDIIRFSDGSIGIIIADVSGHGIPAALITMVTKFIFHTYAHEYVNPLDLMKKMNSELLNVVSSDNYVTAFYMIIDVNNNIRFSCAGHGPAIIYRESIDKFDKLHNKGLMLGVFDEPSMPFKMGSDTVARGDRLILYTDGITDQTNLSREQYGEARMMELIRANRNKPVDFVLKELVEDLNIFKGDARQKDDISIIIIEITADPADVSSGKIPT